MLQMQMNSNDTIEYNKALIRQGISRFKELMKCKH